MKIGTQHLLQKLVILICMGIAKNLFAQQRAQYSQYMTNNYLLNPAVAGTTDHYDVRLGYRTQWTGMEDAPRTFYLTGQLHLGKHIGPYAGRSRHEPQNHHGLGIMLVNDVTGPLRRTSTYLTYSYVMKLTKTLKLSVGANIGYQQLILDGSKVIMKTYNSNVSNGFTAGTMDGALGVWLYDKKWYAGASVQQIFQNKVFFNDYVAGAEAYKFTNHYFLTGGLKIDLNQDWYLLPSFMVKYAHPAPTSIDINCKTRWRNLVWLGTSYRTNGSVVMIGGLTISNRMEVFYSYDYVFGKNLAVTGYGSHEISIAIKPNPKGRVYSPSDFW
ncbi:MAG: type IX secretion system membrane protein PorP/SprF [Cytophagaceae bacterium]|jgi:type IX secretion system PorP/SprF family membrane protein|nr:type IX secretion system membrane protein PorP/SprF [Cytophagaceae bacterium]